MSLRSLAAAAGLLFALAAPSAAEAAYTAGSVNLRTGPGTGYPVIVTAEPGAWIKVNACQPGWCSVTYRGYFGWMAASYIVDAAPRYKPPKAYVYVNPPPPPPVYVYPKPYPYPGPYVYKKVKRPKPYVYFGVGGY